MDFAHMDLCLGNVTCPDQTLDALSFDLNSTMTDEEAACAGFYADRTAYFAQVIQETGAIFCPADWQIATCWGPEPSGSLIIADCPSYFGGSSFYYPANFTGTASRQCFPNGTWAEYVNYTECVKHRVVSPDVDQLPASLNQLVAFIHFFGYSLSIASCLLAILIYTRFRSLCQLRNVIHLNLIATYIISAVSWIAINAVHASDLGDKYDTSQELTLAKTMTNEVRGITVAFTYGQLATFFWALCEGIYMTCILFRPHKLEQMTYWPFGVLGWIIPAIITAIWASIKFTFDWDGDMFTVTNPYNLIFGIPSLAILAVNMTLLLISLYTILRRQHVPSRNGSSIVSRGVKSFLILMPLLGLTYLTILILPNKKALPRYIIQTLSAILLPVQGFCVSVLYCFCNRQVRGLLKFHCYQKLAWLGCHGKGHGDGDGVDNGNPKDREVSSTRHSVYNRSFNPKKFNGNTNELQYILKAQKRNGKFRPVIMDNRTESLRISKSNSSRSKLPIAAI